MGHRQHPGLSSQCLLERCNQLLRAAECDRRRHSLDSEAKALGADIPADVVGGVILVPDDNFVAGTKIEAVEDRVVSFGGISGKDDLLWGGSQKTSQGAS